MKPKLMTKPMTQRKTCLQPQDEVHHDLDGGALQVEHQQQQLHHKGQRQEGLQGGAKGVRAVGGDGVRLAAQRAW